MSRQEASKLQQVLQELKATKELCLNLENEEVMIDIYIDNSRFKSALSSLHIQYNDIVEERN